MNVILPSELDLRNSPSHFGLNALTQDIILGYNFSRAYHIGTNWNNNDEMCLTRNGKHLTATITTKAINAIGTMC